MKAKIHITLKSGVLDPQGQAITNALHSLGFAGVENVRQGKYIEIDLGANANEADARKQLDEMCQQLLANPIMENYSIEVAA